jgi:hypothetical protein
MATSHINKRKPPIDLFRNCLLQRPDQIFKRKGRMICSTALTHLPLEKGNAVRLATKSHANYTYLFHILLR